MKGKDGVERRRQVYPWVPALRVASWVDPVALDRATAYPGVTLLPWPCNVADQDQRLIQEAGGLPR
jgi:hypothetical protein